MKTGRFIQKLENNVIQQYETEGFADLLNQENTQFLLNRYKDGEGEYTDTFKDDCAIAITVVTPSRDDSGRLMLDSDSIVIKLTAHDFGVMLEPVIKHFNLFNRMFKYLHNNGDVLVNPLPEVNI